ncbi:MAG: sodium:proton antiporter [Bacteroidales bacterium]|nr:sodium:proton antiporter [Bacteroidales bacterium]
MIRFKRGGQPSWWVSLIPFVVLVAALSVVIYVFGTDALSGASQVALMFAAGITVTIAMVLYRIPWKTFEDAILDNITSVGTSIVILLLIGAVAGSLMVSGVVPTMIYYGMKVIFPGIFLFASCVISALIAVMTGSSWTTIATIGVALVGIGTAQGYEPGWIAGAIISGAYFGDKVSPLSDTTVLASSSAGTPLFTHIRFMMVTTVPSFMITLIIFLVASIVHDAPSAAQTADFASDLRETYNISPWLFLVPVLTALLIIKKVSAIATLFIAATIAGIAALVFQPHIIGSIATGAAPDLFDGLSFLDGFKGLCITYYGSTAVDTGNEVLNNLTSTRGMTGMLNTVFLIIAASTFGGVLVGSGMLQSLTDALVRLVKRRVTMVASTVGTGIFANMITGDQYLSILLTSSLYKKLYQERRYESKLLSRSVEDSATVVSVLIPWNSCGMTQATVLKVSTLTYLPFCFFNIISPFMSILIAAIGYKIKRQSKEE